MKSIQIIKSVVVAATLMSSSVFSFAQKSGVFKTYADYSAGKMEYGIDCAKETHKIKLNDFWDKDFITVIHEGKTYDLKKAETWGFQLCDEKIVRFQGKDDYVVGDKGILWVYSKTHNEPGSVKTGTSKPVTTFYFSKGGDGEIKELTLLNLKGAFPDNHMLHDAIDAQFKTDVSLGEFDQFHKKYKVNHFLEAQGIK
jgi:hypothetical protein